MNSVLRKLRIFMYIRVNDPAKLSNQSILINFSQDYRKHSNYFTELASKKYRTKNTRIERKQTIMKKQPRVGIYFRTNHLNNMATLIT